MADEANVDSTSGAGSTGDASAASSTSANSGPLRLTDDMEVIPPGQEKPVKYGEFQRGFQSQFTKASQKAANLEREIAGLKQAAQQQQQAGQPQTPSKRKQLIDNLKARTYLSGEEAASAIDNIFGEVENDFSTRDQALRLIAQKLLQIDAQQQKFSQSANQSSFSNTIKSALTANKLPEELDEFAQLVYLSHEGADLDQEFPTLLKGFWDKFANVVRQMDQKKVEGARTSRFPGRGGQGSAGKPLDTSRMSPSQQADALWEMVQGSGSNS
jgi:hypothetical protein